MGKDEGKTIKSYFPHDANARNDSKLIRLRMKHKAAGYGVYFMILERLREEPEYMSVKDYNMIAFDLREDASLIKSVVEDFGLFVFTEDGEYFYSEGFSNRMKIKDQEVRRRSEAGKKGMQARWKEGSDNNVMKNDNNVIESDNSVITMLQKNITSKEKKSKVKETPPHTPPVGVDEAREAESFSGNFRERTRDALISAVMSMGGVPSDAEEMVRLSNGGQPDSPVWGVLDCMMDSPGMYTMQQAVYTMQQYEKRGLIQCSSRDFTLCDKLLRETLKAEEVPEVLAMLTCPEREKRCLKAIADVRQSDGKIKMPARYIMSDLRKVAVV